MLQDHVKSIALTGALIGFFVALIAWSMRTPVPMTAGMIVCRFGVPLVSLFCFVLVFRAFRRPDLAPDYLRQMFGRRRFDCQGFSFALDFAAEGGVAWLEIYYQNRYERPSRAKVFVRRMHGFAMSAENLEVATVAIEAGGGAMGVMRWPLAVPAKWQGKRKGFEVNASVAYDNGRGKLLRFHPGRRVGSPGEAAGLTLLTLFAGVLGPALESNTTGRARLRYPRGVMDTLDPPRGPRTEVLWRPGDEVIDLVAVAKDGEFAPERVVA